MRVDQPRGIGALWGACSLLRTARRLRTRHPARPAFVPVASHQPRDLVPFRYDFAWAQIDLDSRIREIKRNLFDAKEISISLRPNFNGRLKLSKLLADAKMRSDGEELLKMRRQIFETLFSKEDQIAIRMVTGGAPFPVHVLLTGGSASVPIIRELATGILKLEEAQFRFLPVEKLPDWIDRLPRNVAQQLANVYSQCAVAIGGSVPKLPVELDDFDIPVMPSRPGVRRLQRTQTSGL
jgi:hypothetical protein